MTWAKGLVGAPLATAAALLVVSAPPEAASLTSAPFGTTADGQPITRYTMTSRSGVP